MSIEQTVVINTDTKSLADLRKEISQIQSQLDLTPTGTKEYDQLVVRLREAKGEIKDFKEATKGLDPDQRAAKLVNAFQGMTGAIQSAAGAITLFGGNSEDLEKVEKNLLGIIAIGGGIQQTIEGYNDAIDVIGPKLKGLGSTITEAFTTGTASARAFNVALAGLGIGIVVLAVNQLSEAFRDNKKAQEDAAKEAELSLKRIDNAERKKLNTIISNNKKQLASDLETARERGASDLELVDIKLKSQQNLTKAIDDFIQTSNTQTASFIDEQNKLSTQSAEQEIEIQYEKNAVLRAQREKDNADAEAKAKERAEFILQVEEDLIESIQELRSSEVKDEREQAKVDLQNELEDLERERLAKVAKARKLGLDVFEINQTYDNLNEAARINYQKKIAKIDEEAQQKRFEKLKDQLKIDSEALTKFYEDSNKEITDTLKGLDISDSFSVFISETSEAEVNAFLKEALPKYEKAYEELNNKQKRLAKKSVEERIGIEKENLQLLLFNLATERDERLDYLNNRLNDEKLTEEQRKVFLDEVETTTKNYENKKVQLVKASAKEIVDIQLKSAEDALAIEKLKVEKQQELENLTLEGTKSLFADLLALNQIYDEQNEAARKQAFEQQKLYSIAIALIDTYVAAQKAYASQLIVGDPTSIVRAQIAAGVAVAVGLGRVAVISAQQYNNPSPSQGSGGGGLYGGSTTGGLSPFGAEFGGTNVLPPRLAPPSGGGGRFGETTGSEQQGGNITPVFKTYVLAGDVTDAQTAEARLNQKRKL